MHTIDHLDLTALTENARAALAILVDEFLNDGSLADDIAGGHTNRLPMVEIDRADIDAKTELSDELTKVAEWLKTAAEHIEHAAAREACERDHGHWRAAPNWCICGTGRGAA